MRNRLPKGKGFFIWGIKTTEGGDPQKLAQEAKRLGLGHVFLHIHDGYLGEENVFYGADLTPYIKALNDVGVECWGWGAVYKTTWLSGAKRAIEAFKKHPELIGYGLDAEAPIKGAPTEAENIMKTIRAEMPDIPIGLSSYRFPDLHGDLPFAVFRKYCDFDMPQVYWEQSTLAKMNLVSSYEQYQRMSPKLPYFPTGPIYKVNNWAPTVAQIQEFLNTCKEFGFEGVNFWVWFQAKRDLPALYEFFGQYKYGEESPTPTPGIDVSAELAAIRAATASIEQKVASL
jgi:hypothetical protein